LHQAFARVWWKFSLQTAGDDVNWAYKIGDGWKVTGIGSGPDTACAVAQTITRDIMTGTTTVKCGAPSHLGYDDLVALLKPNRLRTVPSRAGAQQFGFDKNDKDVNEQNTRVPLWVTRDGVSVQLKFDAEPV
jgi:hypothetical protein